MVNDQTLIPIRGFSNIVGMARYEMRVKRTDVTNLNENYYYDIKIFQYTVEKKCE